MSSKVIPTSWSGFFLMLLGLGCLGMGDLGKGDFLVMLDERSLKLLGLRRVLLVDCLETLEVLLLERTLGCLIEDKTELLGGGASLV